MRQERQRAPGSDVEVIPDVLPEDDRARARCRAFCGWLKREARF